MILFIKDLLNINLIDYNLALLIASCLVPTDTVGVLTMIKEKEFPKIYTIIFGEGVLNDAVCLVLFKNIMI